MMTILTTLAFYLFVLVVALITVTTVLMFAIMIPLVLMLKFVFWCLRF